MVAGVGVGDVWYRVLECVLSFALIPLQSNGKLSMLPGIPMSDLAFKKVILNLL